MNIKFSYLYRDGANYKLHNEVIFSNSNNLILNDIEKLIFENLIDGLWFVASEWGITDIHFPEYTADFTIDHEWHEFISVENTFEDVDAMRSIDELLSIIRIG